MRRDFLRTGARVYLAAVMFTAALTAILLWSASSSMASVAQFLLITGLGMVAHSFPVQASRHQAYQATLPFIVVAAASFSIAQLIVFILLSHAAEQARVRRGWYIQVFKDGGYCLAAAARGVVLGPAARVLAP